MKNRKDMEVIAVNVNGKTLIVQAPAETVSQLNQGAY